MDGVFFGGKDKKSLSITVDRAGNIEITCEKNKMFYFVSHNNLQSLSEDLKSNKDKHNLSYIKGGKAEGKSKKVKAAVFDTDNFSIEQNILINKLNKSRLEKERKIRAEQLNNR